MTQCVTFDASVKGGYSADTQYEAFVRITNAAPKRFCASRLPDMTRRGGDLTKAPFFRPDFFRADAEF